MRRVYGKLHPPSIYDLSLLVADLRNRVAKQYFTDDVFQYLWLNLIRSKMRQDKPIQYPAY